MDRRAVMIVSIVLVVLCAPVAAAAEKPDSQLARTPNHGGVYVVAHRGAHDDGRPENTLAAYQRAIDLGCDFVEIDLRTTKDGQYVSIHNNTVDAYTKDAQGEVSDFTLAELKAMDIGSRAGDEWKNERIPTLEEILDLCKGKIGIYMDLKQADTKEVADIISEYGMAHDVIWYASSGELLALADHCPECLPMPDPGAERALPRLIERHQPKVIAAVWRHYSPTFVQTCHEAGAIVIVDESDPSCWEDAIAWGSDGVQTDRPEKFIEFLKGFRK